MLLVFTQCIALIVIILALFMLAEKLKIAYPIVLVVGGLLLSFTHWIPAIQINPEYILIVFLPPLLYEAAWETSWKEFWRWKRVIFSFAFIVVILTSLVVAFVSSQIIPGFTLALGFLLGGIVSPPDAVSATSVLKYVKVPRRVSAIIEGESLLNDASSLIIFRFALIAVSTGHFILHQAAVSFILVAVMGIAIGLGIALLFYSLHKWLPTNANIDIILTLIAPYVMYITAEWFHFSGVLAVVTGGLYLSSRSHVILDNRSRLRASNVWSALTFVLNGLVFMLIGLELPIIMAQLGDVGLTHAIKYGFIITGVLIVTRILCGLGASGFTMFMSLFIHTEDSRPGWRGPLLLGWTGMRGVVSLATALSIPLLLDNGITFPQRNLILFITFMVILITLIVQGLTLPYVIRWLKIPDVDGYITPEQQSLTIKKEIAKLSIDFLENEYPEKVKTNISVKLVHDRFVHEQLVPVPISELEQHEFRKVYLQLLKRQRHYLHELNHKQETHEDVIKKYQELLDIEQEKIRYQFDLAGNVDLATD